MLLAGFLAVDTRYPYCYRFQLRKDRAQWLCYSPPGPIKKAAIAEHVAPVDICIGHVWFQLNGFIVILKGRIPLL